MSIALLCTFSVNAGFLVDENGYIEDTTTKIIDRVVYKLVGVDEKAYYEVYDWFDTYEASETVEEINIVPEIDGIKVTSIQPLGDIDFAKNNHNYSVKKLLYRTPLLG